MWHQPDAWPQMAIVFSDRISVSQKKKINDIIFKMKKMKNKLSRFLNSKTIIAFCLILIFSTALKAQSNQEEVDLYQSMFGMQKKEMIASFVELDSNSPFWVDYDAYELERKVLGQKRLQYFRTMPRII